MTGFVEGLHDLDNGCYGYLQPDGSWGPSNAGLVADQGDTLLVDTLMDLPRTRKMLDAMKKSVPAAAIGTLVNTHSNPDHTFGNQLVEGATIISSDACLAEMKKFAEESTDPRGNIRTDWRNFGDAGKFFNEVMWTKFSADGFVQTLPTRSFSASSSFPSDPRRCVSSRWGRRIPGETSSYTSPGTGRRSSATFCSSGGIR